MIGETIGNFKIVSRLGRGGMGEVWLAEQQSIGTKVAIKLLLPQISEDVEHVQRFFNEARAVSRIQHAGIVKIFDVGHHAKQAYLIMEYLEGETLAQRIRRIGPLPLAQISDVGRQIASVLDATHNAGITHRDLKPENIFIIGDRELARGERVKILDFGIAKLTGTLAGASPRTTGMMGTPAYMAPEQWGDASKVDWRADLYSLGCVAFELACGRPPFVVTTMAEACAKHLHEEPVAASSIAPAVPAALDALIARLLAKDPAARPASMREVSRAFEAFAGDTVAAPSVNPLAATVVAAKVDAETVSTVPPGATASPTPARGDAAKRSRLPLIAAALATAAAAGLGGAYLFSRDRGAASSQPALTAAPTATTDAAAQVVVGNAATVAYVVAPASDAAITASDAAITASAPADAAIASPKLRPPKEGTIDPERLHAAFERQHDTLNKVCFQREAEANPNLKGDGSVSFTLGSDGYASAVVATAPTPKIARCLERVIRGIEFPKPTGGPVKVTKVPLVFVVEKAPAKTIEKVPAKTIGDGTLPLGSPSPNPERHIITADEVKAVVEPFRDRIKQTCASEGEANRVSIRLGIRADGGLFIAQPLGSEAHTKLGLCVSQVLLKAKFPKNGGGANFTLSFLIR